MKKYLPVAALLLCFVISNSAAAQVNAALSGTVSDASGALIPGVEVTAKNINTGISDMRLTNESGAVVERLSYDAWGKRRFPDGSDDPTGSITSQTVWGFTGQEQLTGVGLVHLNGRVYDPLVGRMMSADEGAGWDCTAGEDRTRKGYCAGYRARRQRRAPVGGSIRRVWRRFWGVFRA